MRNVRRWVHEAWAPNGYKLVYGCRNKDTSVFESTFYCSAATAALAAYAAPSGSGWGGGESPNASSSIKGWPGQCGVHLPGLAPRRRQPEREPECELTSSLMPA
ncbi:unnamed protein product [Prunus armeniaca]